MSLATRCPVCQTVFRVVQDQLKVSEGWVRCGRCAKVFNAFEGLFDLEREFPALRSPTPSQRVLEDLATRNRQAKPPSPWDDDFDGRAPAPGGPPAASAPATTVSFVSRPTLATPGATPSSVVTPPLAASPSSPAAPAAAAAATARSVPSMAMAPGRDATAPAAKAKEPTPPVRDDEATVSPLPAATRSMPAPAASAAGSIAAPAVPPARAAPTTAAATSPATSSPTGAASTPATASSLAASAPVTTRPAAKAVPEVGIREEPAPLPGAVDEPSTPDGDESFDALFRSDGEMAQPSTAGSLDIDLHSDVEPASLDDAVDSRLLTFVQQAERAERWRDPRVRAALALGTLLSALLLAAHLLVVQRDVVVAQWPSTRSLVQSLCAPLGCRIEPLRRIDQLSVDSSGLTRIDDGPVYRLALVLRNRSETPLLVPAIDLSLTDAAGVLVTRRMLTGSDLGSTRGTIGAGQELPLQALLMSNERALTGYTIEIFYP